MPENQRCADCSMFQEKIRSLGEGLNEVKVEMKLMRGDLVGVREVIVAEIKGRESEKIKSDRIVDRNSKMFMVVSVFVAIFVAIITTYSVFIAPLVRYEPQNRQEQRIHNDQ